MSARNCVTFIAACAVVGLAVLFGAERRAGGAMSSPAPSDQGVPYVGRIEVLNGCGETAAAQKTAAFLRDNTFDVKAIGNASSWNYPFTIVVSRKKDMEIAGLVAKAIGTDKIVLVRTDAVDYDVTVIVGADYKERIR
jgi:hypothetical protein